MFGDNFFFAGLSMKEFILESGQGGFQARWRLAVAELFGSIFGIELNVTGVPLDVHVRDVIGDVWNRIGRGDTGDVGHLGRNRLETTLPFLVERLRSSSGRVRAP